VSRVQAALCSSLVLLLATPSAGAEPRALPGEESAETVRGVADVPHARYRPQGGPRGRPLRRVADLLEMLWDGRGSITLGDRRARPSGEVLTSPLPWRSPEAARLVTRTFRGVSDEATLALVLSEGDAWCTTALELPPESRLRFEATALSTVPARVRLRWRPSAGTGWEQALDASPARDPLPPGADLPLPSGDGRLCFEAEAGAVSVGEPRILAPEPEGADPRPRWIVLTVCDALRADVIEGKVAERVAPAMSSLARVGQRYLEAVASGAHTQAGVWPLLTGRDLARVDPLRAGRFTPHGTPLALVYSRANLAVTHLAQAAGYHTVFLGNNSFLKSVPLFERFTNRGSAETGTVETIAALPAVLARYADERVFLLYYVSSAHSSSVTPRRLFERLGCPALSGKARSRCAYEARVAHADEAVLALQQGLADRGLAATTLQVLTADHGEVLGDGRKVEIELYGKPWSAEEGHGGATHWNELHVPLVVSGAGARPGSWAGRVSSLDVVPTLAEAGAFSLPHRLDGRVLPLSGGPRTPAPVLVSTGYCSQSVLEGPRQLVWWEAECARRREPGTGRPLTARAELWEEGSLTDTDETAPERLGPLVRRHLAWLAARLPGEVWVLDASGLGEADVRVSVPGGRITDWGPSGTPGHLGAVAAFLGRGARDLRIAFRGFPGRFYVGTWPPSAPVRIEATRGGAPPPVTYVGPLQLPLPLLGTVADPRERPELWVAGADPDVPPSAGPGLRVWRQPFRTPKGPPSSRALNELDRVLREWGYIR
jgi:hypothetical protein